MGGQVSALEPQGRVRLGRADAEQAERLGDVRVRVRVRLRVRVRGRVRIRVRVTLVVSLKVPTVYRDGGKSADLPQDKKNVQEIRTYSTLWSYYPMVVFI